MMLKIQPGHKAGLLIRRSQPVRRSGGPCMRCASSSSSSSVPPSPGFAAPPPRPNIYRDLWPSIISCLGMGVVAFYGLELWRTTLDYKWQAHDYAIQVEQLKAQVDDLKLQAERPETQLLVGHSKNDDTGRTKWLGLF